MSWHLEAGLWVVGGWREINNQDPWHKSVLWHHQELILGYNGLVSPREPAGLPELQVQSPAYFHWAVQSKSKIMQVETINDVEGSQIHQKYKQIIEPKCVPIQQL